MESAPLGARLARGAFWTFCGSVATRLGQLALSVVAARLLGQEMFGALGLVLSTIGMLSVLAALGLGSTASRYVASHRRTDPARVGRILGLTYLISLITGSLAALFMVLGSGFLAERVLGTPILATELRLAAPMLFFLALNGAQTGTLTGMEAFRLNARGNTLAAVANLGAPLLGLVGFGLRGMVLGIVAGSAISCLVFHRLASGELARAGIRVDVAGCWGERAVLLSFSLPTFLVSLLSLPVLWIGNALLVRQPNGLAEQGILNAAVQWRTAMLFLPSLISASAFPVYADLFGRGDLVRARRVIIKHLALAGGLGLVVALAFVPLSGRIMAAYGPGFAGQGTVLVLNLVGAAFGAINMAGGTAMMSAGRAWLGLTASAVWTAVYLILTYLWVSKGALGLSEAFLWACAVGCAWSLVCMLLVTRNPTPR